MINLEQQNSLFALIGTELEHNVECAVIGGSAMMYLGAKEATKDVDLVFSDNKSRDAVISILERSGFKKKDNIHIFKHHEVLKDKPVMMENPETRFDLFVNEVIGFRVSDTVISRIKEIHEFAGLKVKVVSPEDILLMKCATERAKDREDAIELINKYNISWNIIIEESINQTKIMGDIYPVFLFDFLYELKEDYKINIPKEVIRKVRDIGEKIMIEKLKSGKTARTIDFTK